MKKLISVIVCIILMLSVFAIGETVEVVTQSAPAVTIDITQIIISIIGLFFSFVLTWVARAIVPPIRAWLEARTTAEQRTMIYTLIKQLVYAAEQRIGAGCGADKRDYVSEELARRGIEVDFELIEAAVKEMNDSLISEYVTGIDIGDKEDAEGV